MSVINSIRSQLAPIHPEGYPFVGGFAFASIVLFWLWPPLGWLMTLATIWCAYFFRDPARVTPVREGIVVAPADGRVSQVSNAVPPQGARARRQAAAAHLDFHERVRLPHQPQPDEPGASSASSIVAGKFLNADLDKASEDNERNAFVIAASTPAAASPSMQIAGLVARRIVPFAREGEAVAAGQRIGMIRFGSRVDVYLPDGTRALVAEGQTAIAGETVIADLALSDPGRTFRVG